MKILLIVLIVLLQVGCGKLDYFEGPIGPEGQPGAPGSPGTPGNNGSSCTTEQNENGAVILCEDGTSAVILNGVDGQDGEDASKTAYTVVEVIKPCPGNGYREVLLRLYDNSLIGHYSDGNKQFLTFLSPGNYVLTDGSNCHFTVNPDMSVIW